MAHQLSHDEVRQLLGAYALGAVEDDEAAQVEALLLDDHDARAELHALQLAVSWLDATSTHPGEHVWENIVRDITNDAREVVPIVRTRRRRPLARLLAGVAAVVAAIGIGIGAVRLVDDDPAPNTVEAARAAADDPASTEITLATAAGEPRIDAVVTRDGHGYVLDSSLPALSRDETYQLWAITPSGPTSAAVLGPKPGVRGFRVPPETSRLAVTNEPAGGSDQPTGLPAASAELS